MQLSTSQLDIAKRIVQVGQKLRVSEKLIQAALATGWVESKFVNVQRAVDHDSLGVFQQRPSVGEWGTAQQVLDVEHAAESFYRTALRMDKANLTAGQLAAKVQRPAKQYEGRYQQELPTVAIVMARLQNAGMEVVNYARTNPKTSGGGIAGVVILAVLFLGKLLR